MSSKEKDDSHKAGSSSTLKERVDTQIKKWAVITKRIRDPLLQSMIKISTFSARKPIFTVVATILVSVSLLIIGFHTNYHFESNNTILWSPSNSYTSTQDKWLKEKPEFSVNATRKIVGLIHQDGNDVATVEGMERMFEVVNAIQGLGKYQYFCSGKHTTTTTTTTTSDVCKMMAASGFWYNHNYTLYKESNITTDKQVKEALSGFVYPDGEFVSRDFIFGAPQPDMKDIEDFSMPREIRASMFERAGRKITNVNTTDIYSARLEKIQDQFELTFVKSFLFSFEVPFTATSKPQVKLFERKVVQLLLDIDKEWIDFNLSTTCSSSTYDEVNRGIKEDVPLMVIAFITMTLYCCFTLSKHHRIKSQSLLGIGAVFTIAMSLAAGYGLSFILGISLTPLSYLFPYGMIGIGLDDTFILTGAFDRSDPKKDVMERVVDIINDVGMSIAVTTLTTVVAFSFGCLSSLPGVRWFCIYAALTITIDFFYQTTFFVALMVLDDRRIKAKRLDCLIFLKSKKNDDDETNSLTEAEEQERQKGLLSNRIMSTYSRILLKPVSKVVVLTIFIALIAIFTYIASGIKQELDVKEILPEDSFVREYISDLEEFTTKGEVAHSSVKVVFRDVDVSNKNVQTAMKDYINDLVAMPYISSQPVTFWLQDYEMFLMYNRTLRDDDNINFNEKLDIFLSTPPFKDIYPSHILRDSNGTVVASWTYLIYDGMSIYDAPKLVQAFQEQQQVTAAQTINERSLNGPFFTFGKIYYTCEMWVVLTKEITITLIMMLVSVFIISLIFIPHPIAAFILTPTVFAIFIEVIAVMRLAGLNLDPFTSIGIIACLGIVMDYNLHVCQAYFEVRGCATRNETVTKMMDTMGKSIMKCGLTNLLGVLPLSLNSTLAFRTLFVTFVGFTSLGVAHGLIFLPVGLSLIGPMNSERSNDPCKDEIAADSITTVASLSSDENETQSNKEKSHSINTA